MHPHFPPKKIHSYISSFDLDLPPEEIVKIPNRLPPSEQAVLERLRQWCPHIQDLNLRQASTPRASESSTAASEPDCWYQTLYFYTTQSYDQLPLDQALYSRVGNHIMDLELGNRDRTKKIQIGKFPAEFAQLRFITRIVLNNVYLQSFRYLPTSLRIMGIFQAQIKNLAECPKLPHLHTLTIARSSLESLEGLPFELPAVETLILEDLPLRSLEWLPRLPRVHQFDIFNCRIRNFTGLTALMARPTAIVRFTDGYIISLHGLPLQTNALKRGFRLIIETYERHPDQLPRSYRQVLQVDRYRSNDLIFEGFPPALEAALPEYHARFAPSPTDLARRYGAGEQLCPFDRDRIVWEGTLATWHVLREAPLARDDPVRTALADQIGVSERVGDFLL